MRRSTGYSAPAHFARSLRRAFTLVELLMVIVVIAILAAFIMPAVMSAFGTTRLTQVQVEIRGMEGALAQFKSLYGKEPPSRIFLYEAAGGSPSWSSHTGTFVEPISGQTLSNDSERVRSIAQINGIWPNFNFGIARDLNSDGDSTDVIVLNGAECLVFFLGGTAVGSGGTFAQIGFSKNASNPFTAVVTPSAAIGSESREGPFFEFKPSQFKPSLNPAAQGALVYFDPLPGQSAPYVYASSYDGKGYRAADLYVNSQDDLAGVYRQGTAATSPPQKNKSFQIISPGIDGRYGTGGAFDANAPSNRGLVDPYDYDNITNFNAGPLNK